VVALLGLAGRAVADRALDKPAFTATPAELLAAAKAAPADESMPVLRREHDTSFDAQGRATVRDHVVYVVRDAAEDGEQAVASARYRPSYQDPPVMRARVIGPTGEVAQLEPAQIKEMTPPGPADVLDRRNLFGVMPHVQPGSVIESEVVTRDREPVIGGGSARDDLVELAGAVVSYSAPIGHAPRRVERKLPRGVRVRHAITAGRERWSYELPAQLASEPFEAALPGDVVITPYVGAATAASWREVAQAYRAVIDRRIADGPVALPADLRHSGSAASREAVDAIAAWLRDRVHDDGSDFGHAPVAPSPPAAVLARGAGSETERATLLVALLRQAGIPAELVLIGRSWGRAVDPELPGLGGFDRAIVRARPGAREVWIDVSAELTAPGQLPAADQGRRGLVIADDATGLIATPEAASGDNVLREVRSYTAAEQGPSALTVVTRGTGAFDAELRDELRGPNTGRDERLAKQAEDWFGGELASVASTPAADLATPLAVTVAITGARRVYDTGDRIDVYVPSQAVFKRLPYVVTHKPDTARVHDFVWPMPHVFEVETRVALPPGFAPPPATPERIVAVGRATFSERRRVDGQSWIVALRFDTGKRRLSPAELAAVQDAVAELENDVVHVAIDRTAFALRNAGKLREAAIEDERMIALHPREAIHHAQLAELLILAGAGDAARREARAAVALAPADPGPLVTLGWILQHDRLGRDYSDDWDRAGAIAVLQKARAIAPDHYGAAVELARVLQRGASGVLFAPDADLRGAAEAWRAAGAGGPDDDSALGLAQVLIWSGQAAEAETVARSATASEERDRWIVAAIADAQGVQAAIKAARDLRSGDERTRVIGRAATAMLLRQRYDVARALFAEIPGAGLPAPWAAVFAQLTAHPDVAPGSDDPRTAMTDLFFALADPWRKTPVFWDAILERELRGVARRFLLPMPDKLGTGRFLADMLLSTSVQIEGDGGVWRARAGWPAGPSQVFYLVLDRGVAKVIGSNDQAAGVGRYILRLPLGDAAAAARARRLLDWVRGDTGAATGHSTALLKRVWGDGRPPTVEAIQLAAEVLTVGTDADRVIALGARCGAPAADARLACHEVLATAYAERERWVDAAAEYEAVQALDPDEAAFWIGPYSVALSRCGRIDDAERMVDGILAKHADDPEALLARYAIALDRGQAADAAQRLDALVHSPRVTPGALNTAAWYQIDDGNDLAGALELAQKAVQGARRSHAVQNTLAAIRAELGDLDRAVRDNWAALALDPSEQPTDADWYVAARIAEQLGQRGDAIAIYARIGKPGASRFSTAAYAYRRLAALRRAH
jgi:tetratricopeptide (TPR) repeat protein/transglutaminase-like putative cysteine protease